MAATAEQIEAAIPYVWAIVRRRFALVPDNAASADDLFQIGMEAVCRCAPRWDAGRSSFLTFAGRRACGAMQDHLRMIRPGARSDPQPWPSSLEAEMQVGPNGERVSLNDVVGVEDPEPEDEQWTRRLFEQVDALPDAIGRRLRLHVEAELNLAEIAELEGVTAAAICLSMRRAREQLAPRLEALGLAA